MAIPISLEREVNPPTQPVNHIITVNNLTKQFDDQLVVEDVTFSVPRGSIFGFIGPSGCGKTTTVRMLTGIYIPTSGEVKVMGHEPAKFTRHEREQIGYMPQHFILYPDLTIWENLSFAASIYGVGFGRSKRMKELLEFVELADHRNKRVRQISGGMQRRLSLATTLVHEPELLFLDEPTTGLDPVLRKKFWDYYTGLKESGKTMFVTTQYVSDAAYCDMVGMMVDGKLVAVDTPTGLRHRAMGGEVIHLKALNRIDYPSVQTIATLPFVRRVDRTAEDEVRIIVEDASTAMHELVEFVKEKGIEVESIQEYIPPYDDIFITLIRKASENA